MHSEGQIRILQTTGETGDALARARTWCYGMKQCADVKLERESHIAPHSMGGSFSPGLFAPSLPKRNEKETNAILQVATGKRGGGGDLRGCYPLLWAAIACLLVRLRNR